MQQLSLHVLSKNGPDNLIDELMYIFDQTSAQFVQKRYIIPDIFSDLSGKYFR